MSIGPIGELLASSLTSLLQICNGSPKQILAQIHPVNIQSLRCTLIIIRYGDAQEFNPLPINKQGRIGCE